MRLRFQRLARNSHNIGTFAEDREGISGQERTPYGKNDGQFAHKIATWKPIVSYG
jgi:hypothetical protein